MKRLIRRHLILAIAACMTGVLEGCGSHPSSPQSGSAPASLPATVDGLAREQMRQAGIPAMTIALAKKGSMLYTQAYGLSNVAAGLTAQPATIFEIGSITKQFTAALIMNLQEQGKLNVNDTMTSYLPQYGFPSAITIRMLLNQTSGLADFTNFPQLGAWIMNGVSEATVLTAVSQAGLQFQPGTQYAYSNSNYFALGSIIETVTGQTYAANLQQSIFHPLSLTSTYYTLPPASLSATGYSDSGAGVAPVSPWNRSAAFAAGALSSNVYDLVAWDNALISGKVVSAASFQQMTTPNGFNLDSTGDSYGFGLVVGRYDNRPIIWHTGQIGGFYAENVVFLDDGFTLVLLTNDQDFNTDPFVLKLMNAICNSADLKGDC